MLCWGVSAIKGIGFLHDIAKWRPELFDQYLIVVAGKAGPDSIQAVKELAECGSMVVDRHLTDDELVSLYGVADIIWSCYRPDYDQASGIFGRAYQAGKLSLVRSGTVIEDYAHYVGAQIMALDYGKPDLAADDIFEQQLSLGGKPGESHSQSVKSMRDLFVTTLKKWQ